MHSPIFSALSYQYVMFFSYMYLHFSVARYKLPANFFNPNVRLNQLVQAVESLSPYQLEGPEACNIHLSGEVSGSPSLSVIQE